MTTAVAMPRAADGLARSDRREPARLHPATGFLVAILAGSSAFIVPSPWWAWVVAVGVVFTAFAKGDGPGFSKAAGATIGVLAAFMFAFRVLFTEGAEPYWTWGGIQITDEGFAAGVLLAGRVLALAGAILLYFRLTRPKDIVAALQASGMPTSATYVLLSTLQMIPELRKQVSVIMDAQRARGVETEGGLLTRAKAFVPVLGPLVLSSLMATEERAVTLQARAFTVRGPKTQLHTVQRRAIDIVIRVAAIVAFVAVAAGAVAWRVWA